MTNATEVQAEVLEVEATPIEEAIEPMSDLDMLIADVTSEAARLSHEYQPREITTEEDYQQSKRERTGARKDIAALKARYTEGMRALKDAIAEADARMKQALSPLDQVDAGYKREVDEYERRWKLDRKAMLAEEYEGFAPDLVPLVPFERLMARYGCDKGKQWDARSLSDGQAIAAMQQAVELVARDEQVITGSAYDEQDKAALKADFFQTLDLSGALRRTQEAKEQRERVARLERERAEREAAAAAEMERLRQEREAAQAQMPKPAPAPEPQKPIIDTHSQLTYEEYLEEMERLGTPVAPKAQVIQHAATVAGGVKPGEAVPEYVFAGYGNAAQASEFVAFCDRCGIRRRVKLPTNGVNYQLTPKK